MSSNGSGPALFGCLRRWGDALFELTDAVLCAPGPLAFGAVVEPRTGVPPLPRQPLQGARPWSASTRTRLRPVARRAPPRRLAAGVRRRRLDVGSLRRRVQPRAGLLLLGVEALRRPADRRRLVLPVDQPARLGARLLDGAAGRAAHPAQANTTTATVEQVRRPRRAPRRSTRCRCSCSTPATTRSPSVTTSPTCAARCCAASVTTVSSTPTRRPVRTVHPEPVDGRHDTDHGSHVLAARDLARTRRAP